MPSPAAGFSWSRQETSRTSVSADACVAVAARRETVEAGLGIMSEGGNAVDAAVSMAFVAAVVEPTEASIGGSGFMLVHDAPSARSWSIEFPPRAPLAARPDMFALAGGQAEGRLLGTARVRDDANATGTLAPCVPGAVAGLCLAQKRFGRCSLPRVMEPAIDLAESGFEVDAYFTLQATDHLHALRASPGAGRIFLSDGLPPVAPFAARADPPRVRQVDLARTLVAIAEGGPDGFYRGAVADAVATAFADHGGLISRSDLEAYRATVERPLGGSYRGWSVMAPRAPGGGWTALQALGILDHLPLTGLGRDPVGRLHVVAEALQLAFADRYHFAGDPKPGRVPLGGLLSESYCRELARMIRRDRVSPPVRALPETPWEGLAFRALNDPRPHAADAGHGTTHVSTVDSEGRLVSCTLTAGNTFGSKFVADGTGVLFDSGMAWFHPQPGTANSIAPGKRPLVNMAPLLLLKERGPRLALGAAGGRRIISAVTQVVTGIVDDGLDIQEAISAPRLDASDRALRISDRFPAGVPDGLRALGHEVLTVSEEHAPFSYEFARPAAAGIDDTGLRSGGVHPFSQGFVAGR